MNHFLYVITLYNKLRFYNLSSKLYDKILESKSDKN